ncbi:hypothetical protein HXP44_32600 [Streptomyces sioyaensis]|uniref:hypothetical protein n=1 Tax=Streptomyces sioyaensis TaxID=67364 RepID=UPI0012AB5DED|nr:hypothetical protein [Streptomyces sioyaensis]MBM4796641.1 hypothetical protein [Streptomyces sioyaensis]
MPAPSPSASPTSPASPTSRSSASFPRIRRSRRRRGGALAEAFGLAAADLGTWAS